MSLTTEEKESQPTKLLASLANEANLKIKINKQLSDIIIIYKNQINEIKKIINKNREENFSAPKKDKENIQLILEYISKIKLLKNKIKEEIAKSTKKINDFKTKLFNNYSNNQPLDKQELDNFILQNTLIKLNNDTLRYNLYLKSIREFSVFREPKRDSSVDKKNGEYYIYDISIEEQRNMLQTSRAFNICKNKSKGYLKKIKENNKKIEKLNYFIEKLKKNINKLPTLKKYESSENIFSQIEDIKTSIKLEKNNNKKKFKEDETSFEYNINNKYLKKKLSKKNSPKRKYSKHFVDNLESDEDKNEHNNSFVEIRSKNINLPLINKYNEENEENEDENEENMNKNKNYIYHFKRDNSKKTKFNLISKEELFEISNYEGKNEAIIDDELHSNDETKFETKVIPNKKIINDYLNKIKKEVPSLNFSQIEFNKTKVMNEADLYSLQRRNFDEKNVDGKIANTKKKIKKLRKRIKINDQKLMAMKNYIEEIKANYKLLRPLKIKSTVEGGDIDFKIQNLLGKRSGKINSNNNKKEEEKNKHNIIEEEEGCVGSDYSDEDKYEEDNDNKNDGIVINGDDDSGSEKDNNNIMKTQAEIKTKIGLNLIYNNNINNKVIDKKNKKKKIKVNVDENDKFNSK